jgi:hypothetical protein
VLKAIGVEEKILSELLTKQSKKLVNMHIEIGRFEKETLDRYGFKG